MGVGCKAETERALTENHGIDVEGFILDPLGVIHAIEGCEGGKVVSGK